MDIEQAIEIFERINRLGQRLSRYDLITASVLASDFDLRERAQEDVIAPMEAKGFGKLEEASIPQALALNAEGRTETSTQMALAQKGERVAAVWDRTVSCLKLAVDYVRHNLGVDGVEFLPYDAMIPMLAYYFFLRDNSSIEGSHRAELDRWFWRVAFSERYSGASQTRMTEDAAWIRELVGSGRPYQRSLTIDINSLVDSHMTSTTSAIRNGVLCLLNLQGPLHLRNGANVSLSGDHFSKYNVAEKHHIFPVGFLKASGHRTRDVHRIPNFCFVPAELNKWIGDRPPSQYMDEIRSECGESQFLTTMRSHLIPAGANSGIWNDNYERFLRQRAELILREIMARCGITDRIREEHRNPLIDAIEDALRDTIHSTLSNRHSLNYWQVCIDGKLSRKARERARSDAQRSSTVTSGRLEDPRALLEYCDIRDYTTVIEQNWTEFSLQFHSKHDFIRNLEDYNEFRNAVKHGRSLDVSVEYRARAAMIWLSRALDLDVSRFGLIS